MKRYKLRNWVKVVLVIIVVVSVTLIYEHRIEEINNRSVKVISENQMAERR